MILTLLTTAHGKDDSQLPPGGWRESARNYHYDEVTHVLTATLNRNDSYYATTDSITVEPYTVINNVDGHFTQELYFGPGKVTKENLQSVLKADQARQKELPGLIHDTARPIDAIKGKIAKMQLDSAVDDETRAFVDAKYAEVQRAATQAMTQKVASINSMASLNQTEKHLLVQYYRKTLQPAIDRANQKIADFKKSSALSDEQKEIATAAYQKQINEKEPTLKALEDELKKLSRKIDDDNTAIANYHDDYVEHHASYTGNDWWARLDKRWDVMSSGRFGSYSEYLGFDYEVSGEEIYEQVGSFSPDGRTTVEWEFGFYDASPSFNPRNDTPAQQKELVRLLGEAQFDYDHSDVSELHELNYWSSLDDQIKYLKERIHNEA